MAKNESLKSVLYKTIHRNKKTLAQIADETGISSSYLYRAGLPLDQSGVKFPIEYLVPLIKSTKDSSILEHITQLCGFMLVKTPRFRCVKMDEVDLIDQYQTATVKAVKSLKDFLNTPTAENYEAVDKALQAVMCQSAGAQKYCDKKLLGQLELEL